MMRCIASEKVRFPAMLAGVFTGIIYVLLGLSSVLSGKFSDADLFRFFISLVLIFYSLGFYAITRRKECLSEVLIAFSSFCFLSTIPAFAFLFLVADAKLAERVSVSLVLGLFLHYGVLRLSSGLGLAVGLMVTIVSLVVVEIGRPEETARAAIFLFAANLGGFYISLNIFKRDRLDFDARNQIKKEWLRQRAVRKAFDDALAENRTWISTISHELYQPLAIANFEINTLLGGLSGAEPLITECKVSAKKIQINLNEIGDVLDAIVSKEEGGRGIVKLKLGWAPLSSVFEAAVEQIGVDSSEYPGLSLIDLPSFDELYLYTDILLLKRVVRNFLENAIKYTSENSDLKLFVRCRGSRLFLILVNKIASRQNLFGKSAAGGGSNSVRLGLGLRLGSRFTKVMNDSLPGHRISFRLSNSGFAVSRISFVNGYFSFATHRNVAGTQLRVSIFSENICLIDLLAREGAKFGLSVNTYSISDLREQVELEAVSGNTSLNSIFLVDVMQPFIDAGDYFGDELFEVMRGFGRFLFISESDLSLTYREIGVVKKFPSGIYGIFDEYI